MPFWVRQDSGRVGQDWLSEHDERIVCVCVCVYAHFSKARPPTLYGMVAAVQVHLRECVNARKGYKSLCRKDQL